MQGLDILKNMVDIIGISGYEDKITDYIKNPCSFGYRDFYLAMQQCRMCRQIVHRHLAYSSLMIHNALIAVGKPM